MILGKSYIGATEASKVYLGATQVYPTAPVGVEMYTWSDAATLESVGEADTVRTYSASLGWDTRSQSSVSSTNTDTTHSPYQVLATASVSNGDLWLRLETGITSGKTYKITFKAKAGTGTGQRLYAIDGFTTSIAVVPIGASWQDFDYTLESNATSIRIRFNTNFTETPTGQTLFIDNISILEL